jgi:sugar/nucleoside kinase (ribokinase family)
MSLLVSGTVAIDHIKTPHGVRRHLLGGSASHFCMSASLLTPVHLAGVVGENFPQHYIKLLEKKKIDLSSLQRIKGETFEWDGEYQAGNLSQAVTLLTKLGVLEHFVPHLSDHQTKIRNIFLANDDPSIQLKILKVIKRARLIGLDTMNLWIVKKKKILLRLLRQVDLFVANETEAKMISNEDHVIKAARYLRKLGPKLIVIKRGENGALFFSDAFMFALPAFPVEMVIDPTGAGDTFAGGLMGSLAQAKRLNKQSLKQAIIDGSVLASFNVEGFGLERTATLTPAQVRQRTKQFLQFII